MYRLENIEFLNTFLRNSHEDISEKHRKRIELKEFNLYGKPSKRVIHVLNSITQNGLGFFVHSNEPYQKYNAHISEYPEFVYFSTEYTSKLLHEKLKRELEKDRETTLDNIDFFLDMQYKSILTD